MRPTPRLLLAILAAVGLTGCTALAPFPAAPQPAAAGVKDTGPRVAICYDVLASSAIATQQAAQQQCAPGSRAERVDTNWKLDLCPVFLPSHATFVCAPNK
ncbi:MAG: hypothetical protein ACREE2_11455 [Stellaceae bacterium]